MNNDPIAAMTSFTYMNENDDVDYFYNNNSAFNIVTADSDVVEDVVRYCFDDES